MGKGKGRGGQWFGERDDAEGRFKGGGKGMEVEEEVKCFSPDSGSGTDESEDEILDGRDEVLDNMVTFIWSEGATQTDLDKKEDVRYLESLVRYMAQMAKRIGYRQAEALNIKHIRDLKELVETERKLRIGTEKQSTRMGEEVRTMVKEEINAGIKSYERQRESIRHTDWIMRLLEIGEQMGTILEEWGKKYERRRGKERLTEWNVKLLELGAEIKRVLEAWADKKGETYREEMGREMEEALRERDDRVKEEMGEWIRVVEEREGGARDIVRKDLEELERWEMRMRGIVIEEVRRTLEERNGRLEGATDLEGQGRQKTDKKKDSGKDKVGKRRTEFVRGREEERWFPKKTHGGSPWRGRERFWQ